MKRLFCIFAFCCMLFAEDVDSAKNSTSSNLNIEIQNSYKIKIYYNDVKKQLGYLWQSQKITPAEGSVLLNVNLSAGGEVIDYSTDYLEGDEIFRKKLKDFLVRLPKQRFAKAPDNKPRKFAIFLKYNVKSDQIKEKR
ncbi:hypothetical protein [uncultured Campylobacter sp.]|uniref:hypothetical protein n=1 Tax=uncultured Campylobacter sp. TaxID=218934 RepID=UPI0015A76D85|nr:hypothetical protein [uncultured Campylobacter sp.]